MYSNDRQRNKVERSEEVRLVNIGLRWRSEAKPVENQARDGARRSEAKSSVGEEIGAVGTCGLNVENGGQGELKRFKTDSRMKRGFVGRILSTFAVLKEKGRFQARFRDTFPIRREVVHYKLFSPPIITIVSVQECKPMFYHPDWLPESADWFNCGKTTSNMRIMFGSMDKYFGNEFMIKKRQLTL